MSKITKEISVRIWLCVYQMFHDINQWIERKKLRYE